MAENVASDWSSWFQVSAERRKRRMERQMERLIARVREMEAGPPPEAVKRAEEENQRFVERATRVSDELTSAQRSDLRELMLKADATAADFVTDLERWLKGERPKKAMEIEGDASLGASARVEFYRDDQGSGDDPRATHVVNRLYLLAAHDVPFDMRDHILRLFLDPDDSLWANDSGELAVAWLPPAIAQIQLELTLGRKFPKRISLDLAAAPTDQSGPLWDHLQPSSLRERIAEAGGALGSLLRIELFGPSRGRPLRVVAQRATARTGHCLSIASHRGILQLEIHPEDSAWWYPDIAHLVIAKPALMELTRANSNTDVVRLM